MLYTSIELTFTLTRLTGGAAPIKLRIYTTSAVGQAKTEVHVSQIAWQNFPSGEFLYPAVNPVMARYKL